MGLEYRFDRIEAFVRGLGLPGLTFDRASGNNAYVRRYGKNWFHLRLQDRWTLTYIFKPTRDELLALRRSLSQPSSLVGPDKTSNYRFHAINTSDMDVVRSLIAARATGGATNKSFAEPTPRYVASQWSPGTAAPPGPTVAKVTPKSVGREGRFQRANPMRSESWRKLLLDIARCPVVDRCLKRRGQAVLSSRA